MSADRGVCSGVFCRHACNRYLKSSLRIVHAWLVFFFFAVVSSFFLFATFEVFFRLC
jgi:hypothetical protein